MSPTTPSVLRSGAVGLLLAAGLALAASAAFGAARDACGVDRDVRQGALDEVTWKQLNNIYEQVGEERYDDAYAGLQRLLARVGRDAYLQAILNQALAQVEWSRGNYDPALTYFEKAIELDALPDEAHFGLMYQIAQLYFMKERLDESLEKLELWFCKVPPDKVTSSAYVLKASIYAQKSEFSAMLEAIETAIAMDPAPKENWYVMKLAAHYELEQYPQAAETLELLISKWPDKKLYWTQLSQIYYRLKRDDRALAVLALAYRKGMLDKQGDLTWLSSMYSNAELPYRAAAVLEQGIRDGIVEGSKNHWTMVADAWYAAEELDKSLAAYERAGEVAEDGGVDLRRAYILVDMERWPGALDALNRALEKGGLDERRTGEAYLLRGMAHFNLDQFDSASADWGRAGRYETSKKAARQWIEHLQDERRRRAS
jgi:tetratricopeptide (TPR) repeat protein